MPITGYILTPDRVRHTDPEFEADLQQEVVVGYNLAQEFEQEFGRVRRMGATQRELVLGKSERRAMWKRRLLRITRQQTQPTTLFRKLPRGDILSQMARFLKPCLCHSVVVSMVSCFSAHITYR